MILYDSHETRDDILEYYMIDKILYDSIRFPGEYMIPYDSQEST